MNSSENNFEYDVTFSFAGEDRAFVESVAESLKKNGVRIFYDDYEIADMWGKNLIDHLDEIYRKKAKYCVIFISKYYKEKLWTNHERKSAQARAFQDINEYILPFRLDDTEIPGILPTTFYLSIKSTNAEQLVKFIMGKIGAKFKIEDNTSVTINNKETILDRLSRKAEQAENLKLQKLEKDRYFKSQQFKEDTTDEFNKMVSQLKEIVAVLRKNKTWLSFGEKVGEGRHYGFGPDNFYLHFSWTNPLLDFFKYPENEKFKLSIYIYSESGHHGIDYKQDVHWQHHYRPDKNHEGILGWSDFKDGKYFVTSDEIIEYWADKFIEMLEVKARY